MLDVKLEVEGLNELVAALKKVDRGFGKAMRLALNEAAEVVVNEAKPRVPARSGRARGSIRAKSTQRESRIQGGSGRVPYYPWLDFGGRVGRKKSVVRPFYSEGRYIYDAYYEKRDSGEFEEILLKAIKAVVQEAGLTLEGV